MCRKHTLSVLAVSIITLAVSPLTARESRLKSGLKPTKADRRILQNCPSDITLLKTPRPLQRDLPAVSVADSIVISEKLTLDSIIEVGSDITTNQIWTANNTYHIISDIDVQALLVIEPGTVIKFAADTGMFVNNGGTLISCGTPDNPVTYTSDSAVPGYGDYYCPIQIEETASASTKVTYSYIEYAVLGIVTSNKRLDCAIENNYLYKNVWGVVEYGIEHTDIINNLICDSYNYGIDVNMASEESEASANSRILIQNNTCDNCYVGILVRGVANDYDAGEVTLTNNIVSNSPLYGLALVSGYMYVTVINTGYYGNLNDTYGVYEEFAPVYESTSPYVTGTGTLPACYLRQDSTFVNASVDYIEQTRLIGRTTAINGFPDSNILDLGFHYPNWQFSNAGSTTLYADFDNSFKVDFNDLIQFADYWLYDYNDNQKCESWDLAENGVIDLNDLAEFAESWLTEYNFGDFAGFAGYWQRQVDYRFGDRRFDLIADNLVDFRDWSIFASQWGQETTSSDPNIQIQISGDPNNGYVDIGVTGYTPEILQISLLVDGRYAGEMVFFEDNQTLRLDTSALGNGTHELKTIGTDINDNIICSNLTQISLNHPFIYCTLTENYIQNQLCYFSSFYQGSDNINVKVYDEDNIIVWSQTYPAQNVNGYIPSSITSRDDLDLITFQSTSSGTSISKSLSMAFIPWLVPSNIRALLLLPDEELNENNWDVEAIVEQTFQYRGVPYYKLKSGNASYKNLSWFALNRNIEYIYLMAHGASRIGQAGYSHTVPRTVIRLSDGKVVSAKQSDFYPGYAPPWCEELPGTLEETTHSMTGIYFVHGLKFVQFDSCWSAHWCLTNEYANELIPTPKDEYGLPVPPPGSQTDMSWAMGMNNIFDSFYQGWWEPYTLSTPYQSFKIDEWTELRDGATLYEALYEAIWHADVEVLQNFVIYGYGDMYSFRIE